jgi:hypothetical protein
MKDYRSLESKIRAVVEGRESHGWTQVSPNEWVHHTAGLFAYRNGEDEMKYFNFAMEEVSFIENANDEKRIAEPIVGRPKGLSKLNKQIQIKQKIIDEGKDDPKEKKKEPPKDKDKKFDDKNPPKQEPGDKPAGKKDDGAKPAGKNDSVTKPAPKDNSAEIRKVSDGGDTKDPKKLSGGKTEVDINPTTDDDADDNTVTKPAKNKEKVLAKEDLVTELSARTLKNYVNNTGVHRDPKYPNIALKKIAAKKEKAQARKLARNEGFSEEELKYFDLVMAEDYVDMTKKNVDAIINAKGKPHKVYTNTDETRHGISVDELKRHLGVSDSDGVHKKFMHNLHTAGVRTGWSHSSGKWICYHGKKI